MSRFCIDNFSRVSLNQFYEYVKLKQASLDLTSAIAF
jgi:hypothetical protein